ncbi:MAG: hypothetical protein OHK0039_14540 [Bacteroidia bacterium]
MLVTVAMVLASVVGAGMFAFHFYFLFPRQSDRLFVLRHNTFDHLDFYTDAWSYAPGDSLTVYASSGRSREAQILLYDVLEQQVCWDTILRIVRQPIGRDAAVAGCGWQATARWVVPAGLRSGWYVLEMQRGRYRRRQSLCIRPELPTRRVALLLSTHTWNAYNPWGGKSLYTRNYSAVVSGLRPQPVSDPWLPNRYTHYQLYYQSAGRDLHVAHLLDSLGIAFDAYSMEDLHRSPQGLMPYDVLIFSTHTEYWTPQMMHHLNRCLQRGASTLFLAGNVAAYVSHLDTTTRRLTVYKREDQLWGVADTIGVRPLGTEYSFLGFHTYAPYAVQHDTSWAWAGTKLRDGDLVGLRSETYDYTYMYDSWWRNLVLLSRRGRDGAAAGLEIDKVYAGTPANWVQLGTGLNPLVEGHGEVYPDASLAWEPTGADMGYYVHPGGGIVFHASSMAFTGALPYDAALRQLVANLVHRGLTMRHAPLQRLGTSGRY